jgi:hypothetical protein
MDNSEPKTSEPKTLQEVCYEFRAECLDIETRARATKKTIQENEFAGDKAEMIAQITLAYRAIEDARMRFGKVVQYYDGGTSVYPR